MEQNVLEQILDGSMEPMDLPLETLKEITNNFSTDSIIGRRGGMTTVYKGVLRNGNNVAVKKNMGSMAIDEELFLREVDSLMEINHPNAVRFIGFCSYTMRTAVKNPEARRYTYAEKRERLLCFEYISNGSLDNYITDELRGLDWDTRFQIIKGICMGLCYLHMEKRIPHMDLKPANILLDNQMVPKIKGFCLSRPTKNSQTTSENHFSSPGYAAPETMFLGGRMSVSSDIYSLGAIIMELVTGHKGVPDNSNNVHRRWRHRWNKSAKEMQPAYQRQVTKCIEIGRLCQEIDPIKRPFISNIVNEIREMESMNNHVRNADESTFGWINPPYWDDDMLGIEPLELRFDKFEHKNKQILSCSVKLINDTSAFIAFEIRTTSPLPYSVEPNNGIVGPRSKFIVDITMHSDMAALQYSTEQYTENFIVRSIKVDEGLTTMDINQGIFDMGIVDEVSLTVVSDNQLEAPCASEEPKKVVPSEYSCGLLRVHPRELRFPFKPNKSIACSLHLTNNADERVSFRLKKKGGSWTDYLGELLMHGTVLPRSTYTLVVAIREMEELPRETEIDLVLQSSVVDEDIQPFEEQGGALNEVALKAVCDPQEEITSKLAYLFIDRWSRMSTTRDTTHGTSVICKKIIPFLELTSSLWCLDAHPTEPWIIIAGHGSQVHIWNYDTQSIEHSFKASETIVRSTKIVARKQWLLAGDDNGYIHAYDYVTKPQKQIKQWLLAGDVDGYIHAYDYATEPQKIRSSIGSTSCHIPSLAIHPTKPYVLSANYQYIDLWDWNIYWKCIQTFKGHSNAVRQVAFNPRDHDSFVSASQDNTVKVWNINSPECSYTLLGHSAYVTCLDFFTRDDQQYLITGSRDRTAKIWDMQKKTCIHTIEDFPSPLTCVVSLLSRPFILTGSEDGLVHMWSTSDYRLERTFAIWCHANIYDRQVYALACSTGSNRVIIGKYKTIAVVDIDNEEPVAIQGENEDFI